MTQTTYEASKSNGVWREKGKSASRIPSRKRRMKGRSWIGKLSVNLILVLAAIASLIPMVWLAIAPSKLRGEFDALPPMQFGSFENYGVAWSNLMSFQDGIVLRWLLNSILYTAVMVVIATATAVAAGFALAATSMPLRKPLLIATLVAMLVPAVALVLPLFLLTTTLGLYNTPQGLILVSVFNPFGTFLAYIHFTTTIPHDLYEAARMDGSSELGLFFRIALPLSKGLMGMVAFFAFTAAWSNYFLPYVIIGSGELLPLPVGLGVLFSGTPALNPGYGGSTLPIGRPEIALAGLLVAMPILLVFLLSSRFLVRGALSGAVKS